VTSSNSGLKTYLLRVISGDQTGVYAFLVRIFLNGLECIYRILSGLKFMMAHRHQLPVPVISIGNITVGGTGKTPTVIWLVKLLKAGYSFTNNALVDLTAVATGDEPFLLAKLLPDILIGVGRERYQNGLKALVSNPAIDLFVLDDGFQHWSLARDLDIIVIDASRPFSNRHLLPRGFLREPLSSLKRAGIILLTRTTKVDQTCIKDLTNELLTINPNVTIASIEEEPSKLISLTDFTIGRDSGQIAAAQFLSGRKISAITGIGNPRQFLASLENMGAEVGYFKAYPDHYNWEEAEIIDLIKGLAENGFLELIVTAKDGVKLEPWADMFDKYRLTCYILSLEFSVGDQQVIKRIKTVGKAVNS
jgi:tetraacyldisaccharide 4'-kinase